ncbi:MAG: hypothetical protein JWM14_866 [Chitinophagaceae bacterium]|nr:hypothetical protein [Chitinophagaceae bacterium]
MFNTNGLDPDFIEELEISYTNINYKKKIISQEEQLDSFQQLFSSLGVLYHEKTPQVVNCFQVESAHADIVFIQTYIDEGYEFSMKRGQSDLGETIQGWAYAKSKSSIGETNMRPELFSDKVSGLFGKKDINFAHAKQFSDKYHLLSTEKDQVEKLFNKDFLEAIGQTDNLILMGLDHSMVLGFPDHMYSADDIKILLHILSKASFLDRID